MGNAERETIATYLSMLINGLYFLLMMYVFVQAKKGIYIFDITAINWYMAFFCAITGRIIYEYLDKKYSDETLLNQAMENSLPLSYLHIFSVIIGKIKYIAIFFIVVLFFIKI